MFDNEEWIDLEAEEDNENEQDGELIMRGGQQPSQPSQVDLQL